MNGELSFMEGIVRCRAGSQKSRAHLVSATVSALRNPHEVRNRAGEVCQHELFLRGPSAPKRDQRMFEPDVKWRSVRVKAYRFRGVFRPSHLASADRYLLCLTCMELS